MEKEKSKKSSIFKKDQGLPQFSSSFKQDLSFEALDSKTKKSLDPKTRQALKSAVLESLIQQNEDLQARLTVSHRRVSLLEEKMAEVSGENSKFSVLKDQYFVLKEKLRMALERKSEVSDHVEKIEKTLKKAQINYSNLYSEYKSLEEAILKKERKLTSLEKHSKRVRYIYSLLKKDLEDKNESLEEFKNKIKEKNEKEKTLEANIQQTTQYISKQASESKEKLNNLEKNFAKEKQVLLNEIEKLLSKKEELEQKATHVNEIYKENARMQNELVFLKSQKDENLESHKEKTEDLEKKLSRSQGEISSLQKQVERLNFDLSKYENTNSAYKEDQSKVEAQLFALQDLLRSNQTELEEKKSQCESLMKLNKDLSLSLGEKRRNLESLKKDKDSLEKNYQFKLKSLQEALKKIT